MLWYGAALSLSACAQVVLLFSVQLLLQEHTPVRGSSTAAFFSDAMYPGSTSIKELNAVLFR
jgi:hypothetical protein